MEALKFSVDPTPAMILYRSKLFLRNRADIRDSVVPLPLLNAEIRSNGNPAITTRAFIKNMVCKIAEAGEQIAKEQSRPLTFAVLLFAESALEPLKLSVRCAQPAVARRVADLHKGPFPENPIEVNHKYSFILDTWIPLVFHCGIANSLTLATNQNHIADPFQFLEVERCKMTSGFLNFLGVLSLLQRSGAFPEFLASANCWVATAMHEKCDELLRWVFASLQKGQMSSDFENILVSETHPERWYYNYSLPKHEN